MATLRRGRAKPRGKYNNKRVQTRAGWFDSKGEMQRYYYLLDAEKKGLIDNLKRQVPFSIDVNKRHICDYIADFTYTIVANGPTLGVHVVEDFKGVLTDVFLLKAKLMQAVNGITIKIVKTPTEDPCKG